MISEDFADAAVWEPALILTEEAVDDSKQAAHGTDDGRDDVVLPLYLQAAGVHLGRSCRGPVGAQPGEIRHSG